MENIFGTTSDMVIQTVLENDATYYLAIDAKGVYLTTKERLDTEFADSNRYSATRNTVPSRLAALGMDPAELFEQNKHLIKVDSGVKKKVNPLKASKRGGK